MSLPLTSTSPAFWVLNYEKQQKEGTCKVSGRSVVFSAFYADFCLCPKLLIITTLNLETYFIHIFYTELYLFLNFRILRLHRESILASCSELCFVPQSTDTQSSIMCKVYTRYHGTREIEHGMCACTVDNPLTWGSSLCTGLSLISLSNQIL